MDQRQWPTKCAHHEPDLELAFITIPDESALKDPVRQQLARTQAIRNSLQRKRNKLRAANENFVDETQAVVRRSRKGSSVDKTGNIQLSRASAALASAVIDPFGTLAVDADRLTRLLQQKSARQAGEPVLSVKSAFEHQGLRSLFNAGLEDPGLTSALCLALAFEANGGVMDQECAQYRLNAMRYVTEKLSDSVEAASNVTIGTILLLVGIEARLGERETAQMHLNGTRQLLLLSNEQKTFLSHAIRRAIFWQDLISSMIVGTRRVFSYETFPEVHWHRDPFQTTLYTIPSGFERRRSILGDNFIDIMGDISALQHVRESWSMYPIDNLEVEKIDNQQAWIESRLETLRHEAHEPLLSCCIPAAYLCAYGFFTDIWDGHIVPSGVTSALLRELQIHENWSGWDDHADLLLWLVNIGATFAVDVPVRLGFAGLWHGSHRARLEPLSQSWERIERHLKEFIWSSLVYKPRCERFWKRLQEI